MKDTLVSLNELIIRLLGHKDVTEIKSEDTFYELGLDSLNMVQLVVEIRELYGIELGIKEMFDNPTVGGLSKAITTALRS